MVKKIKKQKVTLESLSETVIAGFTAIDKKFETVDKRFDTIDKRFETVDKRFDIIDKRFETVDKRFDIIDEKFETVNKKIENEVETLAQMIQNSIVKTDERFNRIEQDISELKDGQSRIEANLIGAARTIDLMDLKAEVETLKRKV